MKRVFFESLGKVKEHFPAIKNVYLAGYSGAGAAALALAQNYPGSLSTDSLPALKSRGSHTVCTTSL